jgi:hypothetical protein
MDTMAPIRSAIRPARRISLTAGPAAASAARREVEAAIHAWDVRVDVSVATLLTSELVTNALTHEEGNAVGLVITCAAGLLRVDVHDTSRDMPVLLDAPADAEAGRGLMLVSGLSTDWGCYRTPKGKAVYFTLACQVDPGESGARSPRRHRSSLR